MRIERDAELRKRECIVCTIPYGKWTCDCKHAACNIHVLEHNREGVCSGKVEGED